MMSVIVLIAGLSVLNTSMKAVQERRREIGTLRSVGFMPHVLGALFLLENIVMSLLGAGLGAVLTAGICRVANSLGILYRVSFLSEPIPLRLAFSAAVGGRSLALLVAVGAGACVLACWRALRLKIVDCLREG